ncbi:MAG: glycosyltransferase family 4 protein [Halocynthiibacter sp.]
MRITQLHNAYLERGGEDAVFEAEGDLLQNNGHEVFQHVVPNSDISGPVAKIKTAFGAGYNRPIARWMKDHIRQFKPDIIHIHNFFPRISLAAHAVAISMGVPVVQTLHNYRLTCAGAMHLRDEKICESCSATWKLPAMRHRCYRGSLAGTASVLLMQNHARRVLGQPRVHMIALTEFMRSRLIAAGYPASQISVKPNFVKRPPMRVAGPREGLLFVGRLSKEKGARHLISAMRGLPDLTLSVVGTGPEMADLRAMAPKNVRFLGALAPSAVMAEMQNARALVMPSLWFEGLPMTLIEAFANGTPVIGPQHGALGTLIEDGRTGVVMPEVSAADIIAAVRRFDALDYGQLARNIQARYEALYTPQASYQMLMMLYAKMGAAQKESPTK